MIVVISFGDRLLHLQIVSVLGKDQNYVKVFHGLYRSYWFSEVKFPQISPEKIKNLGYIR